MARSHALIALGASLFALLLFSQLVANLGFPHVDLAHGRVDQQHSTKHEHSQLFRAKQVEDAADDPSQYLIGVGKADITGSVGPSPVNDRTVLTNYAAGPSSSST